MHDHECEPLPQELRRLFADGGIGRTLPVELPEGSLVWPDPGYAQHLPHDRPAFWISDKPATAQLWSQLRAAHPRSGLWPVLLEESVQPWSAGQIAPDPPEEIDFYNPAMFMAEVWADWVEQAAEDQIDNLAPYGRRCPGLAPPGVLMADPGYVADWYAGLLAERGAPLGLAAVNRGADALAVMGWQGALHHNEWTAPLAAVVRSWEDRFGVRVIGMGFNTLELSVAAPPVTPEHALHVAAEHWAFCPDSVFQGPGTLVEYAEEIRGRNAWSFWWD
ncbi:protein of unknown function [Thermostaphylospora chromogena]|uniref:DUF4253 domain-containing protein n=2 Tax=Thermostaphylospora chromogena TaxID=35622 RepID=A0A1H1A5A7_9ACTN|nr:protein of unknown function [Thermostaphylospora chromogena]